MREFLFYVQYPISGYAYSGRVIKRVRAKDEFEAAGKIADWAIKKFPWIVNKGVTRDTIVDEVIEEPGVFQEGDIEIVFAYDEELDE